MCHCASAILCHRLPGKFLFRAIYSAGERLKAGVFLSHSSNNHHWHEIISEPGSTNLVNNTINLGAGWLMPTRSFFFYKLSTDIRLILSKFSLDFQAISAKFPVYSRLTGIQQMVCMMKRYCWQGKRSPGD